MLKLAALMSFFIVQPQQSQNGETDGQTLTECLHGALPIAIHLRIQAHN